MPARSLWRARPRAPIPGAGGSPAIPRRPTGLARQDRRQRPGRGFFGAATAAQFGAATACRPTAVRPATGACGGCCCTTPSWPSWPAGWTAFILGSELRGLTTVRDGASSYPAVTALKSLAARCASLLGPATKLGYAADWSEYFGHQPGDGSGDVHFHLDPLWSDRQHRFRRRRLLSADGRLARRRRPPGRRAGRTARPRPICAPT
jgi:hypothetical protein